jgi:hypothetical protein
LGKYIICTGQRDIKGRTKDNTEIFGQVEGRAVAGGEYIIVAVEIK